MEPEQHARHLALSTDGASETVAAELERAATTARARGGSDAAADLQLDAARRTPADDPDALRRRIVTAGIYFIQAGDPTRARVVLEEHVEAAAPGPGRAEVLVVLADARSSDDWRAKIAILELALAEAGRDHRLRSRILQALAQAMVQTVHDARGGVARALEAVREADLQDDPVTRCGAYLVAMFAHLSAGDGVERDLLERALALAPLVEDQRVFLWPAYAQALAIGEQGDLDAAIGILRRLAARAEALGDWDSLPLISASLAHLAYRRGFWREARDLALEAEGGFRQNGQGAGLAYGLGVLATVEIGLGHEADGRRVAEEGLVVSRAVGTRSQECEAQAALGSLSLALGDASTAERHLRLSVEPRLAEGFMNPWVLGALTDLAETLVALDRPDDADRLLEPFERMATRLDAASPLAASLRVRGLIAAAAGDEDRAERAFEAALVQHARVPEPFPRGRTLLARGEVARRFRQRGRAREVLQDAMSIFEGLGARLWLERAAAELARTGHREPGASLSPTERQVADLVAAGRTNREVAEALFMSPHTVEAHLTRIYRSLGLRGRTELARAIAARRDERVDGRDADGPAGNEGQG